MIHTLFVTLGAFLFAAPVPILFGTGIAVKPLFFLPMLALSLVLAILIRRAKKGRMLLCVPAFAGVFALSLYLARAQGMSYTAILPSLCCAGMLCLHLFALCSGTQDEYPPTIWYVGFFIHAVALFLLRAKPLAPAGSVLKPVSCAFFVFSLFILNEMALNYGMAGDKQPSPLMRLRNRIRTGVLAAVLMGAVYVKSLAAFIQKTTDYVLLLVRKIIDFLASLYTQSAETGGGGGSPDLSALGEGAPEQPAFWAVLEQILRYAALALAFALALLILHKFIQVLRKVFRFLMEQLRRYSNRVNNAYEDTLESLLDWGEVKRSVFTLHRRQRPPKPAPVQWNTLSPRETVRMSYKVTRSKVRSAEDGQTARQVLLQEKFSPQAADLYDKARYSSQEISEDDARRMKQITVDKK
ncbi:MAG: hypothetical protein IKW00_04890 [Clostridia bacterium]|nr:hypothetical protein [Clostridia bacterium]